MSHAPQDPLQASRTDTPDGVRGDSGTRVPQLKRLARIGCQVRGVSRMIDEDTCCVDILRQVRS